MKNPALKYGATLALISSLFIFFVLYFIDPLLIDVIPSVLIFIAAIFFMWKSSSAEKANNNGHLSFGEGFKAALLTVMIGLLVSLIIKYIIMTVISPELPTLIAENNIALLEENAELFGEEFIDELIESTENSQIKPTFQGALMKFLALLFFPYIPIALIIGLITKKQDQQFA